MPPTWNLIDSTLREGEQFALGDFSLADGGQVRLDVRRGLLQRGEDIVELPAPGGFLAAVLEAGSVLAYVREHGRFPGEDEVPGSDVVGV